MFKVKDLIKANEALSISNKNKSKPISKCISIIDDRITHAANKGYCCIDIYYNIFGSLSFTIEENIDKIESILRDSGYEISDIEGFTIFDSKKVGIHISWGNSSDKED